MSLVKYLLELQIKNIVKISQLSIFIFSFNETKSIKRVVESASDFLHENVIDSELIIINDGSTDDTHIVLEELLKTIAFRLINHEVNLGIGQALRSGYQASTKKFVVAIPGDGQFDVNELLLIQNWNIDNFYSFYRNEKKYSYQRSFLTWFNKILIKKVLNNSLKDVNWIKVYSKKQLELASPVLKSSLIESEISSKLIKAGYQYVEIPSNYLPRVSGKSKGGSFYTISKALKEMLKLIFVVKKFRKCKL